MPAPLMLNRAATIVAARPVPRDPYGQSAIRAPSPAAPAPAPVATPAPGSPPVARSGDGQIRDARFAERGGQAVIIGRYLEPAHLTRLLELVPAARQLPINVLALVANPTAAQRVRTDITSMNEATRAIFAGDAAGPRARRRIPKYLDVSGPSFPGDGPWHSSHSKWWNEPYELFFGEAGAAAPTGNLVGKEQWKDAQILMAAWARENPEKANPRDYGMPASKDVDGIPGPRTRTIARTIQQYYRLTVDGEPGARTQSAIRGDVAPTTIEMIRQELAGNIPPVTPGGQAPAPGPAVLPSTPVNPQPPAPSFSGRAEIVQGQVMLAAWFKSHPPADPLDYGAKQSEFDGIAGARTKQATRTYQSRRGLPVTGELDGATLAALADDTAPVGPVIEPPPPRPVDDDALATRPAKNPYAPGGADYNPVTPGPPSGPAQAGTGGGSTGLIIGGVVVAGLLLMASRKGKAA